MKKSILIYALLFCAPLITLSQNPKFDQPRQPDTGKVYTVVQKEPKFNGDLIRYLQTNIKYPESERKAGRTGKVYISFVVEKDGAVTDVKVLRGAAGAPALDAEAVRVVTAMPSWTPGTQDGIPVRVQFTLPISFDLK